MPQFTEEQQALREVAREVARERIEPMARKLDERVVDPEELVALYRELGWMSLTVPEEYGGAGAGTTEWCIVAEEVAAVSMSAAHLLGHNGMNTMVALLGTDEQKARFFPRLDESFACFMASEPEAGSDVSSVRTVAVREGDEYVLDGRKQWVGHGGHAEIYTVVAKVDEGSGKQAIGLFFVDGRESPGMRAEREEDLMGLNGVSVAEVAVDGVRIPVTNRLGGRNGTQEFIAFMNAARPTSAAQAVGMANAAMEYAVRYTHERHQFGQPVYRFQAVSHMLAQMATDIEAARELTYAAAAEIDRGGPRGGELVSMAKAFATDMAMRVTTDAVQCLGASGYSREHPLERMMRDAKIGQIYEGTNQIQRETIAKLLSRRLVG
ncbi:acyl-CoA dehydrogenase family protein [Pseudonocardia xishanensis]|uniref:Acyl-CoA dehydrogenase family protein n=1 Tax=Pseudonocardia xishanensis TaxID=630995 RepID=A0ABP8RUL3_9PSEU